MRNLVHKLEHEAPAPAPRYGAPQNPVVGPQRARTQTRARAQGVASQRGDLALYGAHDGIQHAALAAGADAVDDAGWGVEDGGAELGADDGEGFGVDLVGDGEEGGGEGAEEEGGAVGGLGGVARGVVVEGGGEVGVDLEAELGGEGEEGEGAGGRGGGRRHCGRVWGDVVALVCVGWLVGWLT